MESRFQAPADMRQSVFFDGVDAHARYSRFWMLLVLSSIIAAAGVVADSTAAVIGAMIVAPLLGPIQGTMLATVLGDRRNLVRSLVLVVTGAIVAIFIGYAVGLVTITEVVAATNSQVAGRVSPRLIDLLAALATGVVGSIALVRRDIGDTLPGVAIAISLVPPLTVVGLTLESGAVDEALGALLLFVTNVVAIIATGIAVMSFYGVTKLSEAGSEGAPRRVALRKPVALLVAMFVVIGLPLTLTTVDISAKSIIEHAVVGEAQQWADRHDWTLVDTDYSTYELELRFEGAEPVPPVAELEQALVERGVDPTLVSIVLVPVERVELGG